MKIFINEYMAVIIIAIGIKVNYGTVGFGQADTF